MFNPFPELLMLGFFAPTLLRFAAALVFAYLAYRHFENRAKASRIVFPLVGSGSWIVWFAILSEVAVAAALFAGYYTQIAALVGMVIALKHIVWRGKYPGFFWITRSAAFLLFVICLSLLASGAGALAFDLPL